jgi:flagellar basal-body rod modification protein FlgD
MTVNGTGFTPFTAFSHTAVATPAAASPNGSSYSSSSGVDSISSNGSSSMYGLSTDDFLKLFLAQLQNQDPTKPMDDSQMLSQLAQMSSIQTMQGIQSALEGSQLAQAANLIGKNVTGLDVNGAAVNGVVTAVTQSNDAGLVLQIGSQYIKPESVVTVTSPTP